MLFFLIHILVLTCFDLKLIKNYFRSTISQERLNGLSILSIEKDILAKLEYKNLINKFVSQKGRKIDFK